MGGTTDEVQHRHAIYSRWEDGRVLMAALLARITRRGRRSRFQTTSLHRVIRKFSRPGYAGQMSV